MSISVKYLTHPADCALLTVDGFDIPLSEEDLRVLAEDSLLAVREMDAEIEFAEFCSKTDNVA